MFTFRHSLPPRPIKDPIELQGTAELATTHQQSECYDEAQPGQMSSVAFRIYDWLACRILRKHKHTQRVYLEWLNELLVPGCAWLDLGCGHQILPEWLPADQNEMVARSQLAVGIDIDRASLAANTILRDRVLGPLESLPFQPNTFDLVTANMVVEHLRDPAAVLAEAKRVLRPGGCFLFHTPNRLAPAIRIAARTPERLKARMIRLFEKRSAADIFPTHYLMNRAADIRRSAEHAGMRVQRLELANSAAVTAALGVLAVPELLFMRMIESERFAGLRSNILCVLQK